MVCFATKHEDCKNIIADIFYRGWLHADPRVSKTLLWVLQRHPRLVAAASVMYEQEGMQRQLHCPLATKESWKWHGTSIHPIPKVFFDHFVEETQFLWQMFLPTRGISESPPATGRMWTNFGWGRKSAHVSYLPVSRLRYRASFSDRITREMKTCPGAYSYVINGASKLNPTSISTFPCLYQTLLTPTAHPLYRIARFIDVKDSWWPLCIKLFYKIFMANFVATCSWFMSSDLALSRLTLRRSIR